MPTTNNALTHLVQCSTMSQDLSNIFSDSGLRGINVEGCPCPAKLSPVGLCWSTVLNTSNWEWAQWNCTQEPVLYACIERLCKIFKNGAPNLQSLNVRIRLAVVTPLGTVKKGSTCYMMGNTNTWKPWQYPELKMVKWNWDRMPWRNTRGQRLQV